MPRKILFESAVHQFLRAGSRLQTRLRATAPEKADALAAWLRALQIENPGGSRLRVAWHSPAPGEHVVDVRPAKFYTRGDATGARERPQAGGLAVVEDRVMTDNRRFFDQALEETLAAAGWANNATAAARPAAARTDSIAGADKTRAAAEAAFHDDWAAGEDVAAIDVRRRNEACTAPEMRCIRQALGDLRGRTLLDIGCGFGEASVCFALQGARVTATDVSPGMCAATGRLAKAEGVALETHVSAAEDLRLGARQFDIVYMGNTLHHVDIEATMERVLPHLRDSGTFVSWDPVAYNPLINVYRRVATRVRTPDEHPLRLRDIRAVARRFEAHELRWFWLTTLVIFLCMVFGQFRNPNRVRLWKAVVDEADDWAWLYRPLEKLDAFLLAWIPWLRPLCWNVVIIGRGPVRASQRPMAERTLTENAETLKR